MSTGSSIQRFVVGSVSTNCYLVGNRYVIDPGGWSSELNSALIGIRDQIDAILLTHAHYDHISAIGEVRERVPDCPVFCHSEDVAMLADPAKNLSSWGGEQAQYEATGSIEGRVWPLEQGELEVLHTPGHTPGSVSLYWGETGAVFAGDTLFKRGIGRTDIPGGSQKRLLESIRDRLLSLPGRTRVFPGHGPQTTIEDERNRNPFL